MQNILEGFNVIGAEITSKSKSNNYTLEVYGTLTINKGNLSMDVSYWAKIFKYPQLSGNYIGLDDRDYEPPCNVHFGNIKVDDLDKLKSTLDNSGLKSLSIALDISRNDIIPQLNKAILENPIIKVVYGEDVILMDALSKDEQNKVWLQYVVNNFEECFNLEGWRIDQLANFYNIGVNEITERYECVDFCSVLKSLDIPK